MMQTIVVSGTDHRIHTTKNTAVVKQNSHIMH